jgi:hypothetical protein
LDYGCLKPSDVSGKGSLEDRVQKMANMSTATCLVTAILIISGIIQRPKRPQMALFLPICSIKEKPMVLNLIRDLIFEEDKCNHNGNSTHIYPFLHTALQNSR